MMDEVFYFLLNVRIYLSYLESQDGFDFGQTSTHGNH